MKVAVFSDVHGNLSALRSVVESIRQQPDLDDIIFAGDLCLFGPRPQACAELIMEQNIRAIVGNTDDWLFRPPPLPDDLQGELRKKRESIHAACQWTHSQLNQQARDWLAELCQSFQIKFSPTGAALDDLLIVHANPVDLLQLIFPPESDQERLYGHIRQRDADLAPLMEGIEAGAIAFGHLHIPNIRRWQNLNLFNISSVSLPGDGDGTAKYAVISWAKGVGWSVDQFRISYDIDSEVEAYRQKRPPGWERDVASLISKGYVPQIV